MRNEVDQENMRIRQKEVGEEQINGCSRHYLPVYPPVYPLYVRSSTQLARLLAL